MQWLYRVIGQAGIFLICAQTVVHFRPKESYDKDVYKRQIQDYVGDDVRVLYSEGCHLFLDQVEKLAREDDRISEAMTVAEHSDLVILLSLIHIYCRPRVLYPVL